MSLPELDAIKARADAATEGPWEADQFGAAMNGRDSWHVRSSGKPGVQVFLNGTLAKDAEFIAAARSDVPRLVAALEAVLRQVDEAILPEDTPESIDPLRYSTSVDEGRARAMADVRQAIERALKEEQ